jgi:hypothetical protein
MDIQDGQWYTDAVLWANGNGIISGYGNGQFGTNDNISREQTATILYRYASHKNIDISAASELSPYTDVVTISAYALNALKWANAAGLIQGNTATTLNPQGMTTRAEVATIIKRFMELQDK